ncbi:hypothetical protein JB92DRAFT_3138321 [Gautieria morchelliformis]|nr:hypothetical protein JB92DRAFT_3138321 [Gautieria morchelliformis]
MEPERRESSRLKKTVRLDEALNTIRQISSDVEYSTEEDSDFIPHETVEAVSDTESIADVSIQSTDELEPPAKVSRGKGRPKGSSVKKVLTICTLAVIVPDGRSNSGGSQRLTMKSSTPFAVAISLIHEAMGCTGVKVKPEGKYLAYSVKGLGGKGISLKMMGSADWIAMQEHIKTLIKKDDEIITMTLVVDKKYMEALRKELAPVPGGKRGKVAHLDLSGNATGGNAAESFEEAEQQCLKTLKLGMRCQTCGPGKYCKRNDIGAHVLFTMPQLSAWARALTNEAPGVDYSYPPRGALFQDFYTKRPAGTKQMTAPHDLTQMAASNSLQSNLLTLLLGMAAGAAQPGPVTTPTIPMQDIYRNVIYPDITTFLGKVIEDTPLRAEALKGLCTSLANQDFYTIDEIAEETEEWFQSDPYNLTAGNARFVVNILRAGMTTAQSG